MNKELVLLVGPPGSGKSTYCSTVLSSHYRISQDDMGKTEHWTNYNKALSIGKSIVIDRMNFNKEQREKYINAALLSSSAPYNIKIVVFHVPAEICFSRCNKRKDHPTVITSGDASKAIDMFFRKYERVEDNEADNVIRLGWDGSKDTAIICDLDGTLCNIDHRMPFLVGKVADSEEVQRKDWKGFFANIPNDVLNPWCAQILWKFEDSTKILFCSGRPDDHRAATQQWLIDNQLGSHPLLMRRRNDFRKDDIIKEIILDFELLPRYNILFWLDDRKQVVDKIRSHGVTVLQCCEGNY